MTKIPKTKVCTECYNEKFAKSFYRSNTKDGLSDVCRSCKVKAGKREKALTKVTPPKTGQFKAGVSGNPNCRPKGSPIERVAKKVFGERLVKHKHGSKWNNLKESDISGNEAVLTYLAEFCLDAASKRERKDILMWFGNMLNPKPKEVREINTKLTIENEITEEVDDMICRLLADVEEDD